MGREEKMREKCKAFKKDLACVFATIAYCSMHVF